MMDGIGSGMCPVVRFGTNGDQLLGSIMREAELINFVNRLIREERNIFTKKNSKLLLN
jgi:hypothetical protein